ncbi:hypothetical protein [Novosphingobium aquimarinum]|uniref:hypothetical protein n=1 Tax=Novosphingobium aquimarinum TaxID=2682494 RepID=UPI0012EB5762|nr:hypothetical protein [Novosphingobium aquimarinum]
MNRILPYSWRTKVAAKRHDRSIRAVLDTPPVRAADDGVVLFSMIGTRVLLPYLVAVKSLWHQLDRGRIVILDDGSLTAHDKALLDLHCGRPEVIPIATVDTGEFPHGGCWERFLTILDRRADEYWIQLDSDTVTLGPVPELTDAITANRSFTLLGGTDGEIGALPLHEIARTLYPGGPEGGHVQARFESRLGQADGAPGWRYVRGCAGFTGFAAGGAGRERASQFLALLVDLIGAESKPIWGTEQIASNFHIANEPDPLLLPSRRYLNYWGEPIGPEAAFVHFVGTHRYAKGAYADASLDAIRTVGGEAIRHEDRRDPSVEHTARMRAAGSSLRNAAPKAT